MSRRTLITVNVLVCFVICALGLGLGSKASAQFGDKFIVSFQSNSGWVINKATRKLMFFQYTKKATVWKSNQQILPADVDLDNCVLQSVGSRGAAVFLYDKSAGVVRFFQVLKDGSFMPYPAVSLEMETK